MTETACERQMLACRHQWTDLLLFRRRPPDLQQAT